MKQAEQQINRFLVEVFNDVLHLEEASLADGPCKNLSVSELHVLEVVQRSGENPSMSKLAAQLRITASTLTVAVKTLEQKGYLVRQRCQDDKRKVSVRLTEKADAALAHHNEFHRKLIQDVSHQLSPNQMEDLARALSILHDFFTGL